MSDETTTEADSITANVTVETEAKSTTESEKGEKEDIDTDESTKIEMSNQESATENSNDLFDSLKQPEAVESKNENRDAVDGEIVSQEPMEVDEPPASDAEDSPAQEPEASNGAGNETEQQENSQNENAQQDDASQDEKSQDNNQHEIPASDEQDSITQDQNTEAVTEMEVDPQSSQTETGPQPSQGKDEVDKMDKINDSVMEQNMEHFNCSTLSEPPRDKPMANDPFDSLLNTDGAEALSLQNDSTAQNESTAPGSIADDNEQPEENDDDDDDSSSHQDDAPEAVDDIEEGKDADEELLPDEEREISEAEKRQAEAYQQEAENEDRENDVNEEQVEDRSPEANIEENGEKETTENENQVEEVNQGNEPAEILQADTGEMPFMPNPNEIREIDFEQSQENPCLECGLVTKCKYMLLKEVPSDEEDPDSVPKNVVHFLCDSPCASAFSDANPQYKVIVKKVAIAFVIDTLQMCRSCQTKKMCRYRFKDVNDTETFAYICEEDCLTQFTAANLEKYVLVKNRFIVEETTADVADTEQKCFQCSEQLKCKYTFVQDNEPYYLCQGPCLNLLLAEQPDRFRIKRQSIRVKDLPKRTAVSNNIVAPPKETKRTQMQTITDKSTKMVARTEEEARLAEADREASFCRRCTQCYTDILLNDSSLQWEAMDFCNESCLGQFQTGIGAACQHCQNAVSVMSMGKYCVRFGFELRQFCRSACLDAYKKGLKVCAYCQQDIAKTKAKILATINGQYKDFCSKQCMQSYDQIFSTKRPPLKICNVCNNSKVVRVKVVIKQNTHNFCSNPCFSAFKFVNNINPDNCAMCRKYFERKSSNAHTIYQDDSVKMFCSKICMTIFIITKRVISPCQWCKVRKYDFDMVQKLSGPYVGRTLCSLNCMQMFELSMNAIAMKKQKCDQCNSMGTPQYHLTMSDASMRNFCTYQCVMSFQSQFSRAPLTLDESERSTQPVPTGLPKRIKSKQAKAQAQAAAKAQAQTQSTAAKTATPRIAKVNSLNPAQKKTNSNNLVISSVTSLAAPTRSTRRSQGNNTLNVDLNRLQPVVSLEPLPNDLIEKTVSRPVGRPRNTPAPTQTKAPTPPPPEVRVETKTQIVTVPPLPKKVANVSTMCKVDTHNKEIQARPMQFTVGCQTDSWLEQKMVIPIPVPIYMPCPTNMYVQPFPCPVPIPLPIPVPVFIPTTRNSANGIMKEIKKIQDKMPADPFEAELLMMAEMVAGEGKKEDDTDSSDEETNHFQNEEISGNNFGDDMLQMALKTIYPTDFDPHSVDLEQSMQANTITPHTQSGMAGHDVMQQQSMMIMEDQRMQTRKRAAPTRGRQPAKRGRRSAIQEPPPQPEPQRECAVMKADENMYLKFTFGVNAWKQWVMTKNAELEKSSVRRKLFKTELLQLTADELNYSLCLFVKEVRKPNGSEYAPDTIYYLVLGIQEYLYENGRIDNIFTDPYYERFTDCLDEVAKKFSVLYNDSQYIVTRVEEEHLWECKQLGAHSPHVLLSTLMFFNTKHFNLTNVEEHMQLSFSHIMKHWKRNQSQGSAKMPGSRNVLLRFYPPQSANLDSRKKKVYEQQENEENPLRCPVKLYEFYLSKCPESVKTRNDVFYLLPERSCVPDSPVWYSTQALGEKALSKMLHRVKMVKEINIALLTS